MGLNLPPHFVVDLPAGVAELEAHIIRHPTHMMAVEAISELHARFQPPGTPNRLKARLLLVVGESGAGKTTVLEDYSNRFPEICFEELEGNKCGGVILPASVILRLKSSNLRRCIRVEMPKKPTQRSFVAAIFGALDYKVRDHWNTDEIIRRVTSLCDEIGVEIILIDEGHNMVPKNQRDELIRDVIEFLKSLLNRIGIPIVVAGLPSLLQLGDQRIDRQMARRMHPAVNMAPYSWKTKSGRIRFISILKGLEAALSLEEPSNLYNLSHAARMYVATGGYIGWVSKYLSRATEIARRKRRSFISMEMLGSVHDSFEAQTRTFDMDIDFSEIGDMILDDPDFVKTKTDNPFTCEFASLTEIWRKRRILMDERGLADVEPNFDRSGNTTLRGKGRPKPKAF